MTATATLVFSTHTRGLTWSESTIRIKRGGLRDDNLSEKRKGLRMLSDSMLRQMVDAMPMPVFVKDEGDHFVYVNRAFETLFQVRADCLIRQAADAAPETAAPAADLRVRLPSCPSQLTESTTFCTSTGERLTMSMIHTESFAPRHTSELDVAKAELREARSELARMRETDPVTQALSRRALRAHTEDAFSSAPAGVLRISVDDLETITDKFGQDVGDDLLAGFSDIVRSSTRPGDLFARIDESEFTLVLRGADREQTSVVAHRICTAVTETRTLDGQPQLALSVTVGAAYSDTADAALSSLIEEAERALRAATPCRNEAALA